MSKLETITIDTPSGSSALQIGDGNTATIGLGKSGDTINIPAGATIANAGTATGFGGDNTPAWYVRNGTVTNNISSGTYHTLVFDTEDLDTDSAFASNGFTVPSGEGGRYLLNAILTLTGLNAGKRWDTFFVVNGSKLNGAYQYTVAVGNNEDKTNNMTVITNLSVGDVVTCQGYHNHGSDRSFNGTFSYFSGIKLIGI